MNFGQAIEAARGGAKICRAGWNGRGMWVCFMPEMVVPEGMVNGRTKRFVSTGDLRCGGYFVMMTSTAVWQPGWLASQADMLGEDWEAIP